MNRKVLIVGGIALAAATAATLFFYTVLADRIGGGEQAVATARVVVAAHSLPRGVKIEKDDLQVETRPASDVPPGAFASPEQIEGLYLAQEVMAGRPITSASLPANGNGGVSAVVPPGMRAVTLHLEGYIGVNRLIQVGDRIDVMASNWARSPGRVEMALATLLQNVEVLAIDREVNARTATTPNITVLVNADQAADLTLADQAGEIRLALRNPIDGAILEEADLRARDVLADTRSNKRVVRAEDGSNRNEAPRQAPSAEDAPISQAAPPPASRAGLEK
ncbi:MAG: Flp pilus assembly protein CpaB [Bryobacterales bacterium]